MRSPPRTAGCRAMVATAPRQRVQERDPRHRRARPQESARRHSGRAEMLNELAAMEPIPLPRIQDQLSHIRSSARQLTEMVNELISDAMMDTLDIAIRHEPVDLAAMLAENRSVQPGTGREEQPNHSFRVAAAPDLELRSGPVARGGRQPGEQRDQVYASGGRMELSMSVDDGASQSVIKDEAPASRPTTWRACSDASNASPPSRRAARARPGSACRSSSASSSCMAAASARKATARQGATFIIRLPVRPRHEHPHPTYRRGR